MADNVPSLDDLLKSIQEENKPQSSSALAVIPKNPDDLVEEDIDSQILSILGLEDVFDLTYEEYASLLKEAAVKGRMPGSQMTTETIELITDEFKRVKNKTGRFKVKPKKVDINKVLDRRQPTPPGAIVKADKLIPTEPEISTDQVKTTVDVENLQEDLLNGIGNILESLITIRTLLGNQNETEQKAAQEDRKEREKRKKKEREAALEKRNPKLPFLKALSKPVDDFFGAVKRFFKNVLLGSVVLAMFRWLKDPSNQNAINKFGDFLQNNAGLILGGLLAIAALPLAPMLLGLTKSVLGGIGLLGGAISSLGGFLGSLALKIPGVAPLASAAAPVAGAILGSGAAAVGVTLAMKGTYDLIRGQLAGGGDFAKVDEQLRNKLAGYGITETGQAMIKGSRQFGKLSSSQEKIYKEIQGKRSELQKLKQERDTKIEEIKNNPKYYKQPSPRSAKVITPEGQKKIDELNRSYNQKASKMFEVEQKVQPQTPVVPGAPVSQKGLPSLPPTNTLPGKQHYGARRPGGRKHAGVDFDAGPNDSFYSRIGGEVTNIGNDPGGYYKYVDIYNPQLGVTERIAEGDTILVRKGQKVSPGTPVAKGTNTTGVFHYEIRKGKSTTFGFEGTLDPISFLDNPKTQPQTSAQIAQTPPPTPSIPSPTGRSNIVPLPIPTGGGSQMTSSGTAPNQAPVPRFSSEDPNNTTTMVVRAIYNIVG